jgi:Holliday junction DNA helicase RuvA
MIAYVKGRLVEKGVDHVVVECHGIGYALKVSASTLASLDSEACELLAHYNVTVDVRSGASSHQLFGFATRQEKELFIQLISVSGVSSTLAMTILSAYPAQQLASSILHGDDALLRSVKGIGPKLAQRVVMELGEKVTLPEGISGDIPVQGNMAKSEALAALCSLGFDKAKAERTLNALLESSDAPMAVEELIKQSLKAL